MSYARSSTTPSPPPPPPPDLLEPDDPTAEGRWWDLRRHDYDRADVGGGDHRPARLAASRHRAASAGHRHHHHDYSVELVDGVPTEVWTRRPWTPDELAAHEAAANTPTMVAESDEAVDKLVSWSRR